MLKNKDIISNNKLPGIESISDQNPTLCSPYSPYVLPFYQTKETLMNPETYRAFLKNGIARFRKSVTYKNYKGFLMELGMDRCQVHGNIIAEEMATVEMHHNMLNIMDIALIITEHVMNIKGYISTFDLVSLLKKVHTEHKVQLVMLSLTPHQLYHNEEDFFIHPDQCIGDWVSFLEEYNTGITLDIARKLYFYLDKSIKVGESQDNDLLRLRDNILYWSGMNESVRS